MTKKKILELIKSGNFTLLYHDNGYCTLHEGKKSYDDYSEETEVTDFEGESDNYIPDVVKVLVQALGGKVDSI